VMMIKSPHKNKKHPLCVLRTLKNIWELGNRRSNRHLLGRIRTLWLTTTQQCGKCSSLEWSYPTSRRWTSSNRTSNDRNRRSPSRSYFNSIACPIRRFREK
jgi:hypothetical protein